MKNQLKNLVELGDIIDLSLFYVISFREDCIQLQGYTSKSSLKSLSKLNGVYSIDTENGWVKFESDAVSVTLTTKD
jgi:hypothetical protein